MLSVALLKTKGGTIAERTAHRASWQYPAGVKPLAKYWLQTSNRWVISVFEAKNIAQTTAITTGWGDEFEITVVPAITGQEGLALAQQTGG